MGKTEKDFKGTTVPALMSIFGYISCSTSENLAVSFANSKPSLAKHATVYHIHWTRGLNWCWYFDESAYPEEKEILLRDGMTFEVLSVEYKTMEGKQIVYIKLKSVL